MEQTRSVGGAGKQLRSERAGLDAARGARAPGSGGGERPPGVGNRRKFEESAFFWQGWGGAVEDFLASPRCQGPVMVHLAGPAVAGVGGGGGVVVRGATWRGGPWVRVGTGPGPRPLRAPSPRLSIPAPPPLPCPPQQSFANPPNLKTNGPFFFLQGEWGYKKLK